jgi:hypothetical protein
VRGMMRAIPDSVTRVIEDMYETSSIDLRCR